MSAKDEKSGQELMMDALNELIATPDAKINRNIVAKRAGLSHSLLRKNSYSNVEQRIIKAQKLRAIEMEDRSKDQRIEQLENLLVAANIKLKKLTERSQAPSSKAIKKIEGHLVAQLLEMYRYNDLLRARLAEKHGESIDKETGEVIHINRIKRR